MIAWNYISTHPPQHHSYLPIVCQLNIPGLFDENGFILENAAAAWKHPWNNEDAGDIHNG